MQSIADIIAANLASLMAAQQINSDAHLARLAKIDQKSIWRIRHKEQSPSADTLDKLAGAFGLQAWQMLFPQLDPQNPPVFIVTATERELYRKLADMAHDLVARQPPKPYK
ncbi:MAG: helix-turn-helix domain-containing protein [Thiobacillaceae bacterium]|nr:helix-turn-helix domain-containing protein [Thiobacillaceae bacterium]